MRMIHALVAAGLVSAGVAAASAETAGGHRLLPQAGLDWQAAPPSLPAGAEAVVLYGDPGAEGLFALRLRVPAGYHVPPHTHPKPEVVTVISGALRLGMGETADEAAASALAAGDFFAMEPGTAHYVYADEETVIQLNSNGPWTLDYVNPADDPRPRTQ